MISNMCHSSKRLKFSAGGEERDFIHVSDVRRAFSAIITHCSKDKRIFTDFELGTGQTLSIKSLIELAHTLSGSKKSIFFDRPQANTNEPSKVKADLTQIRELNWRPVISLEKGLKSLISKAKAENINKIDSQ